MMILTFVLHLQNWLFLETNPEGPKWEARDCAVRMQLRDANEGFMEAHRQVTAPRTHAGRLTDPGHGPRQRLPVFYVQLESQDLRAITMPPYMEQWSSS
jgi:hypothetical protein